MREQATGERAESRGGGEEAEGMEVKWERSRDTKCQGEVAGEREKATGESKEGCLHGPGPVYISSLLGQVKPYQTRTCSFPDRARTSRLRLSEPRAARSFVTPKFLSTVSLSFH